MRDLEMNFYAADSLTVCEKGHWVNDRLYVENGEEQKVYFCPVRSRPPYACVEWPADECRTVRCVYVRGAERYMNYSHNLCDLIGIETLLLKNDGLLLHSSFIRWNGKGILFSAPSGTGKSTQAELWEHYEGAEILNGDRAGIRCCDGEWTAFGLPIAGSSLVYKNDSAPLTGIVVLRQSSENRIGRLGQLEAFCCLYPETSVHQWHQPSAEKAATILQNLLSELPVWLLECRPDEGAVRLLKAEIGNIVSV